MEDRYFSDFDYFSDEEFYIEEFYIEDFEFERWELEEEGDWCIEDDTDYYQDY